MLTKKIFEHIKLPRYIRIGRAIFEEIEKNIYAKNSFLPSERKLARKYNVSTIVINKALNLLFKEGVIKKVPRKGSLVCGRKETKNNSSVSKIIIYGVNPPKDIDERNKEFLSLLGKQFPSLAIEYALGACVAGENPSFPEESDIIICPERVFAKFAIDKRLEPVNNLLAGIDMSKYFLQPFQQCEMNGLALGVPLNFNASVLYCNQRILDKAKLSIDIEALSWKNFIAICAEIKARIPDLFPMGYFDFPACWWENFFYSHGLEIIKPDSFETDIFSPRGISAIKVMKKLKEKNLLDNLTIRRNALEIIENDMLPFFICGPRVLKNMKDSSKWFLAPIPIANTNASAANSFILAINAKSKNISLCKEILAYILSKQFQVWLGSYRAITPVHRQALNETFGREKNLKALCVATESAKMLPNQVESWDIRDKLGEALYRIINTDEPLAQIQRDIHHTLYSEGQKWNSLSMNSVNPVLY
jgi:ABC-type glycerol-3-phosphate transport system substrate-binding protein/DNA-binding transcriptional regulator YhcF (GntR family)